MKIEGQQFLGAVSADLQRVLLACVAALTTFDPSMAYRVGAVVGAFVLLLHLNRFRPTAADWLAGGLAMLTLMSLMWTVSDELTSSSIRVQFAVLLIFVAVRVKATEPRDLSAIGIGYLTGCVWSIWLLWRDNGLSTRSIFDTPVARYGVTGLNPNYTAYALAVGFAVVVLVWSSNQVHVAGRAFLLILAAAFGFGVVQTGTRGALAAGAALIVFVVLHRINWRLALRLVYWTLTVASLAILTGVTDSIVRSNLVRSARERGDLSGRLMIWPAAREALLDHPLVGSGASSFRFLQGIAAHNALLEVGSGLGLAGIALFVGVIVAVVKETRSLSPRRALVTGAFLATSGPIWLSGVWEQSPAAWVTLAVISRIAVVETDRVDIAGDPPTPLVSRVTTVQRPSSVQIKWGQRRQVVER